MAAKFCPYCKCLVLSDGHCRNRECIFGNKNRATDAQISKVNQLCEELDIDISDKDPNKLTKERASALIDKLIKRKVHRELYGSEVDE